MASTSGLLFVILAVTVSYVENAPSTIVKETIRDDLHSRLVFVDDKNAINSNYNTALEATSPSPVYDMAKSTKYKHFAAKSSRSNNDSPLAMKKLSASSPIKMDDERQNWGFVLDTKEDVEDESFYMRPLSLPKTIERTPSQAKDRVPSEVTKIRSGSNVKLSNCDTSIVACCASPLNIKQCFVSNGCPNATDDMFSYLCSSDSLNRAIAALATYYKADQNN